MESEAGEPFADDGGAADFFRQDSSADRLPTASALYFHASMVRALAQLAADSGGAGESPVSRIIELKNRRHLILRTAPWAAAAAVVLSAFVLWKFLDPGTPYSRIVKSSGEISGTADTRLVLGEHATAKVELRDGTLLTLGAGTSLRFPANPEFGQRFELDSGALEVSARPQKPGNPLVLATPQTNVTVKGTRFFMEVRKDLSSITVVKGSVRLGATGADTGKTTTELTAGNSALADGAGATRISGIALSGGREPPVAHWEFSKMNPGGTLVRDSIQGREMRLFNGARIAASGEGGGTVLELLKPRAYGEVADPPRFAPRSAFTVSCRIRAAGFARHAGLVGRFRENGQSGYMLKLIDGAPDLLISETGQPGATSSGRRVTTVSGEWCQLTAVFVPGKIQDVYLDGTLISSVRSGVPESFYPTPAPLWVGVQWSTAMAENFFHGEIADLRLYDRALDWQEIRGLTGVPR